jgi:hypothetical protein
VLDDERIEPEGEAEFVERLLARAFVIAGGVFWISAAFAGPYVFGDVTLAQSVKTAAWPFITTVAILLIGWRYERLAAVLLFAASTAVVVWGVIYEWETGVWIVMTAVLIAPLAIAALLFTLASRTEEHRSESAG